MFRSSLSCRVGRALRGGEGGELAHSQAQENKKNRKEERMYIGDRTELIYLFLSDIGNRPSEMKRKCLSLGILLRLAN